MPEFDITRPRFWTGVRAGTIYIDQLLPTDWLILNNQQSGYYRVNYDEENWKRITNELVSGNFNMIHRNNRAQLIDDAFTLARSGVIHYSIAFNLSRYLTQERDFIPLYSFYQTLEFLEPYLQQSPLAQFYRVSIIKLILHTVNNSDYPITGLHH